MHKKNLFNPVSAHIIKFPTNKIQSNKKIMNTLLTPQDNRINKPLDIWINELNDNLFLHNSRLNQAKKASSIAELYNQAALLLYSAGDANLAREICYTQIQLFISWSEKTNKKELLKYVFYPWLILSRIDTWEGCYHEALIKLQQLNLDTLSSCTLISESLPSKLIYSLHDDPGMYHIIKSHSLIETARVYLAANRFSELMQFIEERIQFVTGMQKVFLQEAQCIAYANKQSIERAARVLISAQRRCHPAAEHIIKLRQYELALLIRPEINLEAELIFLNKMTQYRLQEICVEINDIYFGLYLAHVLTLNHRTDLAIKLIYFCLQAACNMQDDVLKAESLVALYHLVTDIEPRRVIENLMIEHYFSTHYQVARMKMKKVFPDLMHVEDRREPLATDRLFEELLNFPK